MVRAVARRQRFLAFQWASTCSLWCLLCAWLVLAPGCLVAVRVDSRPVSGEVETPQGDVLRLPAEVPLRWVPFRRPVLTCTASGYRTVTMPVKLGLGPLAPGGPREVQISFVPEHGPTGTWTEEDVP